MMELLAAALFATAVGGLLVFDRDRAVEAKLLHATTPAATQVKSSDDSAFKDVGNPIWPVVVVAILIGTVALLLWFARSLRLVAREREIPNGLLLVLDHERKAVELTPAHCDGGGWLTPRGTRFDDWREDKTGRYGKAVRGASAVVDGADVADVMAEQAG